MRKAAREVLKQGLGDDLDQPHNSPGIVAKVPFLLSQAHDWPFHPYAPVTYPLTPASSLSPTAAYGVQCPLQNELGTSRSFFVCGIEPLRLEIQSQTTEEGPTA